MNLILAVVVLLTATMLYTLFVRPKDIPPPDPVSPTQHLDERKAAIYENLRDLQFEYRVGKLSDADYQNTKLSLQKELAAVLAEIESLTGPVRPTPPPPTEPVLIPAYSCRHCGKRFATLMKFCGACGRDMA